MPRHTACAALLLAAAAAAPPRAASEFEGFACKRPGEVALFGAGDGRCAATRAAGAARDGLSRARAHAAGAADALFRSEDVGCCPGARCPAGACAHKSVATGGAPPGSGTRGAAPESLTWDECVCQACPPGSVQPLSGSRTCVACPAGWHQTLEGQRRCVQCGAGRFNPLRGLGGECTMCPAGTYSHNPPEDFRAATGGVLAERPGDPPHVYSPLAAAQSCRKCPAGMYQPTEGAPGGEGECKTCPAGTFSDAGAANCTACPPGTFNPYDGQPGLAACQPCEPGACNDKPGAHYCWQCCPLRNQACDDSMRRAKGVYPNTYGTHQAVTGEPEESVQRGHLFEGDYEAMPSATYYREWNMRPTFAPLRGSKTDTSFEVGAWVDMPMQLDTFTKGDVVGASYQTQPAKPGCQPGCDFFGCSDPTERPSDGCATLDDSWRVAPPANEHNVAAKEDDWVARTEARYESFWADD